VGSTNAPTCLAVLWGHTARVWGVAPAGFDARLNQNTHIVSVGEDSTARLWEIDVSSGSALEGASQGTSFGARAVCQLEGRSGTSLWRVVAGPAGVPIATAADDGSIRLWRPNLESGLHVAAGSAEGEGKADSVSGMSAEQWHALPDASADSPYFSRLRNVPVNRLEFVRAMVMLDRNCVLGDAGRPPPPPTAADGTICAATNRGYLSPPLVTGVLLAHVAARRRASVESKGLLLFDTDGGSYVMEMRLPRTHQADWRIVYHAADAQFLSLAVLHPAQRVSAVHSAVWSPGGFEPAVQGAAGRGRAGIGLRFQPRRSLVTARSSCSAMRRARRHCFECRSTVLLRCLRAGRSALR
jgi:hypothetical protein